MKHSTSQKRMWRSVLERDGSADGRFVYAVRTTGIYCRPSCPSRRPKAESVDFFSAPAAAERAGYRPCKRCEPHQPDRQRAAVLATCRYIDERYDERMTLKTLGRHAGLSPFHLQRLFRKIIGVSPREYQEAQRMAHFKTGVNNGSTISGATFDAGFSSSSRLYEKSAQLGMTPARYRHESGRVADTVPSRDPQRRGTRRLSLGCRAQSGAACAGRCAQDRPDKSKDLKPPRCAAGRR